jgi:predicted TIM-barrel fold metal-dependent hydrolase
MTTTTTTTRLIATLESYLSPTIPVSPPAPSTSSTTTTTTTSSPALHLIPTSTLTKLRHLGTARARDMRALGHTTQIVSHVPVPAALPACAKANDALHAGMALFGERFAGLALLPGEGADAARELQRCVTKYRFVGGVLGLCGWGARGEAGTVALDGARFEGVWEAAQRLRVPVILRGAWADTAEVSVGGASKDLSS